MKIDTYYVSYIGDTLQERLRKHNTKHKGFTGKTNVWVFKFVEKVTSKNEAYARELYIKSRTF